MSKNFDSDELQGETKTMKQEKFELVSAYLDGEVTPLERQEVEALIATDPVTRHLYQRLLQLHSEFQRMPITPAVQPIDQTVDQVFDKIDRRSKRKLVLGGGAIAALCIAAISGIISATRSPVIQLAKVSESETLQIGLNEPVIDIVNPNNVMLTVNQPLFKIPEAPTAPVEN
ncbi:MAG: anti-sigma factor [Trichodesmium sp.]